ncbi:unnamed protein product [Ambrosiozyma monospora]|uniref:Condensin complex subunit 2 n=1 Tax=Ambrosiozyma monospora TaxID=43982 RepID=A0A9W6YZ65_AMBMO|nr:unnamed protein product [Ambrosiozyma monospora]
MSQDTSVSLRDPNENDFELWIRMATDNKINSANSWNFGLIDYFHDLRLLKQGDSINFQKATSTLDGCVKIYSSRVDSAATDTGKLLSGLTLTNPEAENDADDEDEYVDEEDQEKAKKKKSTRHRTINTLVKRFDNVKIKEVEKELYVDPIFKKALSDFDEGGAKSLLTNMLRMSSEGRVIFDATDNSDEVLLKEDPEDEEEGVVAAKNGSQDKSVISTSILGELSGDYDAKDDTKSTYSIDGPPKKINIAHLSRFLVGSVLDDPCQVCPSIEKLEEIGMNDQSPAELLQQLEDVDEVDYAMSNAPSGTGYSDGFDAANDDHFDMGFGDDGDFGGDDFDDGPDDGLPNDTKNRTQYSLFLDGVDNEHSGPNVTLTKLFEEHLHKNEEADEEGGVPVGEVLDKLSAKNWRGPQNWRVARIRNLNNLKKKKQQEKQNNPVNADGNPDQPMDGTTDNNNNSDANANTNAIKTRTKRKFIEIDFFDDSKDKTVDELFKPPARESRLLLPEKERGVSETANCLPYDLEFTAKRFIYLNLKPEQRINTILTKRKRALMPFSNISRYENEVVADEQFFAETYSNGAPDNGNPLDYDFGDDNGLDDGGIPSLPPPLSGGTDDEDDDIGGLYDEIPDMPINSQTTMSQRKLMEKHTGITYARVAKRVNVRLLKQNLWDSLEEATLKHKKRAASHFDEDDTEKENDDPMKHNDKLSKPNPVDDDKMTFTEVVSNLSTKYSGNRKAELSTSFCFICLLHLANENGFSLEGNSDHSDLYINK